MQYAILGFTVQVDILFIRRQGMSQISWLDIIKHKVTLHFEEGEEKPPYSEMLWPIVMLWCSPSTLTGAAHQWTAPTNKDDFWSRFSQWEPLDVTNVARNRSSVARTSKCGWLYLEY